MVELIIAACLGQTDCRDFPLLYDAREVPVLTCMIFGQAEIVRWQQSHPGWQVQRWRCEAAGAWEDI